MQSVDGFVAGPNQTRELPFGDGPVERLHAWMFDTPDENKAEVDEILGSGAYIMGRNMFGPIRGEWDLDWRGWWGEEPPFHNPVFVLTHFPRELLEMQGTIITFVTDGIESALAQARAAAGERNVAIAGGAATINQYLRAGHIEVLRIHIAPVVIGSGERLFDGVDPRSLELVESHHASLVTHTTDELRRNPLWTIRPLTRWFAARVGE